MANRRPTSEVLLDLQKFGTIMVNGITQCLMLLNLV